MTENRYVWRGVARVYWLPAVANPAAPTRAEINAGTNLTPSLFAVSGFVAEADIHPLPSLLSDFVAESVGVRRTRGGNALALYENKTSQTVRAAVAEGTAGFVVIVPYGDVVARRCETWPAKVATLASGFGEDIARFRAIFAVTAAPTRDAVLPA